MRKNQESWEEGLASDIASHSDTLFVLGHSFECTPRLASDKPYSRVVIVIQWRAVRYRQSQEAGMCID